MRVGVSSLQTDPAALLERVREQPGMLGADLSDEVTTSQVYRVDAEREHRFTVAALDLGIKRNVSRRPRRPRGHHPRAAGRLVHRGRARGQAGRGLFFARPGDPATADHAVGLAREVLARRIPLFGICFGSQILGRALGFGTYKLGYGHRGINQPVLDRTTGKVEITSHNHGFAVDAPAASEGEFGRVEVSHVCLNDDVVEGLRCLDVPAFTVQYHPEAAAGPHDADYLFDRFKELIEGGSHA